MRDRIVMSSTLMTWTIDDMPRIAALIARWNRIRFASTPGSRRHKVARKQAAWWRYVWYSLYKTVNATSGPRPWRMS
jgi:hypothetical protein